MKGLYTILLLISSNIFMTFAWYGHLKLQEMKVSTNWPLYAIILFSWSIALAEILLHGSGQPHRIRRQWRSFLADSVEDYPRSDYSGCLYCIHYSPLQGRKPRLEPSCRIRLSGTGGLLCLLQIGVCSFARRCPSVISRLSIFPFPW